MKTTFFSLFLVLCLVCTSSAAPTCGTVDTKAAACITFASGKVKTPPPACCAGLKQLAGTVKTVDDKKAICRCLKAGIKNFAGVQDKFLSQLPAVCKINVGFPVSLNTDCEKIH